MRACSAPSWPALAAGLVGAVAVAGLVCAVLAGAGLLEFAWRGLAQQLADIVLRLRRLGHSISDARHEKHQPDATYTLVSSLLACS